MQDRSLAKAIDLAQRAAAALLEVAPLRNDAQTRAIANKPGVYFATTITPHSASIALIAGDERVEAFRYSPGAPGTFSSEAA